MTTRKRQPATLGDRLRDLFHPGPLAWILGLVPRRSRFKPGPHLHGLADRDIAARDTRRS